MVGMRSRETSDAFTTLSAVTSMFVQYADGAPSIRGRYGLCGGSLCLDVGRSDDQRPTRDFVFQQHSQSLLTASRLFRNIVG
jgi:hypothetical protein